MNMMKCKHQSTLTYSILIIKIIQHFNVPFDGETFNWCFTSYAIGLRVLHRMGYKKTNGEWSYHGVVQEGHEVPPLALELDLLPPPYI